MDILNFDNNEITGKFHLSEFHHKMLGTKNLNEISNNAVRMLSTTITPHTRFRLKLWKEYDNYKYYI